MARGLNPRKERFLVLECDKNLPAEEQSRFYYRLLDYGQFTDAQDNLVEWVESEDGAKNKTRVLNGTQERTVLLAGLIRFENFCDEDGNEIVYPAEQSNAETVKKAKLEALTALRPEWRKELARAILNAARPTEKQKGESVSPSV